MFSKDCNIIHDFYKYKNYFIIISWAVITVLKNIGLLCFLNIQKNYNLHHLKVNSINIYRIKNIILVKRDKSMFTYSFERPSYNMFKSNGLLFFINIQKNYNLCHLKVKSINK